jgi:peptidoglycan hydrolase CwlO-like protein
MDNLTVVGLIGVVATLLGIVGTYAALKRGAKADAVAEGKSNATMLLEIEYIKKSIESVSESVKEILREQKRAEENSNQVNTDIVIAKRDIKALHDRMDAYDRGREK